MYYKISMLVSHQLIRHHKKGKMMEEKQIWQLTKPCERVALGFAISLLFSRLFLFKHKKQGNLFEDGSNCHVVRKSIFV
jgi:hypothetical protein